MDRAIIHIDMDAFMPQQSKGTILNLKGKPVIIGGISDRGVVCAASYEARRFGIHSAMPGKTAKTMSQWNIFASK